MSFKQTVAYLQHVSTVGTI